MAAQIKSFDAIKTNKMFRKIPVSDIKLKISNNNYSEKKEGDVIYQAGDQGDFIYLILSGEIKIKIPSLGGSRVEKRSANDFMGETEFFDGVSRVTSAVAETNCIVYILSRKEVNNLISKNRAILNNLQNIEESSGAEAADEVEEPVVAAHLEEIKDETETSMPADITVIPEENQLPPLNDVQAEEQIPDTDFSVNDADINAMLNDTLLNSFDIQQEEIPADTEIKPEKNPAQAEEINLSGDAEQTANAELPAIEKLQDDDVVFSVEDVNFSVDDIEKNLPGFHTIPAGADGFSSWDTTEEVHPIAEMPIVNEGERIIDDYQKELSTLAGLDEPVMELDKLDAVLPEETNADTDLPEEIKEAEKKFSFDNFKTVEQEKADNNTAEADLTEPDENEEEYKNWDFSEQISPEEKAELDEMLGSNTLDVFEDIQKVQAEAQLFNDFEIMPEKPPVEEPLTENTFTERPAAEEPAVENNVDSFADELLQADDFDIPDLIDPLQATPEENNLTGEIISADKKNVLTAEKLHLIVLALEKVNSNIKLDDVLNSIVEAASELTSADRGTLYIIDDEKNELWSKVGQGLDMREIRLKIGEGLAGSSAELNNIINVEDANLDERFNPGFDLATGYETKSVLCFPIKNRDGKAIGVLQLINSKNGKFSELDEQLLEALSINAAIALENAELVEQLLRTDRLTSLGKMAGFILQDIKKPIITVKHYAEHIQKKQIPPDIKQVLDMLIEQANSVVNLVQTTLSYSEGKSILQSQVQSVNQVLDQILLMLAEFVESQKVKLFKKYDKDALVNIDKNEFYQACFQITKNACDSMPNGGNLYFATKVLDDSIEISIRDTGLGIPDSIKERIFEPFMSHGKKQGTGLGLSITEKIVKDHNGTITVESNLGEGSTFFIVLPIARRL